MIGCSWEWFACGWGRFSFGRPFERFADRARILCLGGPLHGLRMPLPSTRAPVYAPQRSRAYYTKEPTKEPEVAYEAIEYERRTWIGNVMAEPMPLLVVWGMSEADARMHLGELGYSFGAW